MDEGSIYGERAIKVGLDPKMASILDVCCLENGLQFGSSFIDLAARKAGLSSISIEYAENHFGKNWVDKIFK